MKKIIVCISIILIAVIGVIAYKKVNFYYGRTENAKIVMGASARFSESEIESAMQVVKDEFVNFRGCDMKLLEYDEEYSNREIDRDANSTGKNAIKEYVKEKNYDKNNIIILSSNFKTNAESRNYWLWISLILVIFCNKFN